LFLYSILTRGREWLNTFLHNYIDSTLITDYTVEKNIKSDVELLKERLPIVKQNTECHEVYVDAGYYSKEVVQIAKENCVELYFTDLNGRKPIRISVTEYEIDEETKVIKKCPRGIIPIHAGVKKGQTAAHFPKEACAKCELKKSMLLQKEQKKDYVVRVNLKSIEAAKQREKIKCKCEENKSKRAAIEGTNSALKKGHGLSKLRVRGLVKCRVNVGLKVLAQNFKRFARYMLERAKKAIAESQGGSVLVLTQ